ncbi:MAG: translocation/assembly module TamB domain-containing protein [Caulobacteraceae bacterium]|nr:translocation/assembly module TamB domain-containing protein [Caulobacteraceae bacterium]
MTQPPEDPAKPSPLRPSQKRRRLFRALGVAVAAVVCLVAVAALTVRYAVLTPAGRAFVVARLDGLPLGPVGKLHVEGLEGDLWRDFGLRRVEIIDARGAWLDARQVQVRWEWPQLLVRRVHVDELTIQDLLISRSPLVTPSAGPPSGPLPVSLTLDEVRFRLETLPAISVQRGLFQVAGRLDVERRGGLGGELHGRSLLHPGDGLDGRFNFGLHRRLLLDAQAREARGGAIAGLAGLPADRTFYLDAHADGAPDKGRLHLKAQSGDQSMAQLDGGWTTAGGSGQGRISLAASRWTASWMHAFGPELRLNGAGRGLGHNRYDLTLAAASDNATLSAAGELDADRQASPKGLKVQASVGDLSRIVAAPVMGRGAFNGGLSGAIDDWRLAGQVAVERFTQSGYALARVAGPAELGYAKREWRLKADLAGTGGQGKGLVAALAGGAPHATLDGVRLSDGRLLLRSLKADGAGLKLQASGERGLFGGLNFKGQAQLSNLAAAHPGARGGLGARWSASQARAGAAWAYTVDATGANLATGEAELDRLLGPKPTLQLAAAYDKGANSVSKAVLTGAAAKVSAAGQIGKAGELKLALNWTASGPFTAGPLEITGQAKGSGAVTGDLAQPRAALLADFDQIAFPNLTLKQAHAVASLARTPTGVDGLLTMAANSDYGLAHGKTGFQFIGDGLSLTGLDVAAGGASATGSLTLRNAAPSTADLTIAVGPGAFLDQGHAQARVKIVDQPGGAVANVSLTAENMAVRGSTTVVTQASFTANGPLSHLPYTLSADAAGQGWPVKLKGSGVLSQAATQGFSVSFNGSGQVRHADFRTLSPAVLELGGPRRTARLAVAVGGGEADISGEQTDAAVDGKAVLTGVDLAALGEDIAGKVSANVAVSGHGAALEGTLDAQLQGARSRDASTKLALDGHIHAVLAASKITLEATANGEQSADKANLSLVLPAEASAAPFRIAIARTQPISGRFDANGELQPIWELFFGGEQSLGGAMVAQGQIAGTLNNPKLTGHASLANGRFEDAGTGLKLRNLTADVDLSETQVDVRQFSGADAKSGAVSGAGHFSLAAGGESTLTLNVKNFQLLDNDDAKATASGVVTVDRGADGKLKLSGALTIDQATISTATRTPPGVVSMDVVERNRPAQESAVAATAGLAAPDVVLDIQLRAPRHIFVRGLGLNAELSLNAQVGGTIASPQLNGEARVVRGDYDFAGKRFEIDDQGVVYLATSADRIRLNLSASWETTSLTAVIKITGTAARPQIAMTSTPVLPQDEVLSQVLFGSSASQLSPVEAAQLAAAVTALATGGGFDVMGGLSKFARLDRLALGGDQSTGITVSGGKYIGNHVYLELTGGGRQAASAQVEYRANRAFSFISQVGGLGGAKLSVRWRHDYGRMKAVGKPAAPKP